MSLSKRFRWVSSLLDEFGADVVECRTNRHLVVRCRCRDTGVEFSLTVAMTPSDYRTDKNLIRDLRRTHREAVARRKDVHHAR